MGSPKLFHFNVFKKNMFVSLSRAMVIAALQYSDGINTMLILLNPIKFYHKSPTHYFSFFFHAVKLVGSWVPSQGWNQAPAVEARSLNHWATREVPCSPALVRRPTPIIPQASSCLLRWYQGPRLFLGGLKFPPPHPSSYPCPVVGRYHVNPGPPQPYITIT